MDWNKVREAQQSLASAKQCTPELVLAMLHRDANQLADLVIEETGGHKNIDRTLASHQAAALYYLGMSVALVAREMETARKAKDAQADAGATEETTG